MGLIQAGSASGGGSPGRTLQTNGGSGGSRAQSGGASSPANFVASGGNAAQGAQPAGGAQAASAPAQGAAATSLGTTTITRSANQNAPTQTAGGASGGQAASSAAGEPDGMGHGDWAPLNAQNQRIFGALQNIANNQGRGDIVSGLFNYMQSAQNGGQPAAGAGGLNAEGQQKFANMQNAIASQGGGQGLSGQDQQTGTSYVYNSLQQQYPGGAQGQSGGSQGQSGATQGNGNPGLNPQQQQQFDQQRNQLWTQGKQSGRSDQDIQKDVDNLYNGMAAAQNGGSSPTQGNGGGQGQNGGVTLNGIPDGGRGRLPHGGAAAGPGDRSLWSVSGPTYGQVDRYDNTGSAPNKQRVNAALDAVGASPKDKALIMAMGMQEDQNFSQHDNSKDSSGDARNFSAFNLNKWQLDQMGYKGDLERLNDPNNLGEVAQMIHRGVQTMGPDKFITMTRGGQSGGMSYDTQCFINGQKKVANAMLADGDAAFTNSSRYVVHAHHI